MHPSKENLNRDLKNRRMFVRLNENSCCCPCEHYPKTTIPTSAPEIHVRKTELKHLILKGNKNDVVYKINLDIYIINSSASRCIMNQFT